MAFSKMILGKFSNLLKHFNSSRSSTTGDTDIPPEEPLDKPPEEPLEEPLEDTAQVRSEEEPKDELFSIIDNNIQRPSETLKMLKYALLEIGIKLTSTDRQRYKKHILTDLTDWLVLISEQDKSFKPIAQMYDAQYNSRRKKERFETNLNGRLLEIIKHYQYCLRREKARNDDLLTIQQKITRSLIQSNENLEDFRCRQQKAEAKNWHEHHNDDGQLCPNEIEFYKLSFSVEALESFVMRHHPTLKVVKRHSTNDDDYIMKKVRYHQADALTGE
ncbi:MAG: hypothetical protein GJ680_18155 [Alteromonadaceae bacterium]|nr:hypothetical protein [Alteromonadaceae bacterium]